MFAILAMTCAMMAQVTTTPSPIPVGHNGQVTITFDPLGGNGGMKNATACYCHTGLITSASKSNSDWKNVIGSWRGATQPQLTATGDGKWQLVIPNIYTFYGVPETTEITALAFVFHDGPGGSKEGKNSAGGDILIFLGEDPSASDIWANFTPAPCVEQTRPAGLKQGITYGADGTSVTLCTYAASKTAPANHVFLLGDMTNWQLNNSYQLKRDGNYFWITLTGLQAGKEYRFQYVVERADGVHKQISDLYSEKLLHPDDAYEPMTVNPNLMGYPLKGADGGYVTVIQPGKQPYNWSQETLNFVRPDKNNLIIYELWVYDYTAKRSFAGVMERLDYIESLGVNAIELMPVCEFDGNYNWGYSPNHYFSVDKAYGSGEDFKALIDECHKRGIAVIMDMVFNHGTGLNPMNKLYPYGTDLAENPWFNVTAPHSDNVYEDWNHDFAPAHEMFLRALQYWLTEYKVDGYRMDLSHGFCGTSYNAPTNINDYYTNGVQAASPGAYFILEHWGSRMGTERPQLVNNGMLVWANTSNAYCQTAMGWLKEGDAFTGEVGRDGYVSYTCSHDEERPFYKAKKYGNGTVKTNETARLKRIAANVAFNVLLDGPHMIWQFEEIGYDFSINSSASAPDSESSDNRCSTKPRPESRGYFSASGIRMQQCNKIGAICRLRTRLMPQVFEGNPTAVSVNSGAALRTIQWGSNVFAAANFSADTPQTVTLPQGSWYNYLAGESTTTTGNVTLNPGDVVVFTGSDVTADDAPLAEQESEVKKVWVDGQLYILRGDNIYTATGVRLQ